MKQINLLSVVIAGVIITGSLISCNQKKEKDMQKDAIVLADIDTTVSPKTDFYQYATGGWQENNPLPEEESRFGSFDQLGKQTNHNVKELIEALAKNEHEKGSIEWMIGTFYAVGMDTAKIDANGKKPVQEEFSRIDDIETKASVIRHAAYNNRLGISSLFYLFGSADSDNSDMQIAHLQQGGLGLPDRDYYISNDARSREIRKEYVRYMTNMHVLFGHDAEQAEKDAEFIMNLETKLAENSMTRLEQRNPHAVNNKMTCDELDKHAGTFDFPLYFETVGLESPGIINIRQPEFFAYIKKLMDEMSVDEWKTYFRWKLMNSTAGMLSSEYDDMRFQFYGKFLSGQEKQKPRWRRMVSVTNGALGEAVGQKFVEKHFPPEAKERMVDLVANLKGAFEQRTTNSVWMCEETQEKAIEKLHAMRVKIGYPDKWRDYLRLTLTEDSYVQNMLNSNEFDFDYMLSKIGKPVDKEEWHMNPQTVNAYYSPQMNEICFPAGILQPPFFYMDADDAVNYGAIGMVIGHEMTHGFDDKGRLFNKEGNLESWWTKEDEERFNKEAQILIDRYNDIIVLDTVYADGELSLGENIADFGGLNISYTAFQNTLTEEEKNKKINGFTPEQRFFLAYAKVWAQNITDEEILRRTKEDVHSLGKWRVNGQVTGMENFHKAFDVKEEDDMYLLEDNRTRIW
ncbi:MAG: M13 family metallopeptidase [Candidatus Delongbacteria bacterium]|jgi:putative endopeptidase|nr:M13 family metallopeptidase [Candidatus Delongbacteria bacterium]